MPKEQFQYLQFQSFFEFFQSQTNHIKNRTEALGKDKLILSIFFSKSIVKPTATARNVFPVPAGPADITISLCLKALTYSFCFSDLGIIDFLGVFIISVTF